MPWKKLDRCVKDVMATWKSEAAAWAICKHSIDTANAKNNKK